MPADDRVFMDALIKKDERKKDEKESLHVMKLNDKKETKRGKNVTKILTERNETKGGKNKKNND